MQKIPVTRKGKRSSEIMILDSKDVVKIDKIKEREYIVHTKDEEYVLDLSLESIEEWLFEDGFRLLDSANIVNMNHVTEYDSYKGLVYLGEKGETIPKIASAARIHKEHIEKIMEMLKVAQAKHNHGILNERQLERELESIVAQGDERFLRSYATLMAVTERKWAEQKIHHMAFHDSLTNLPNRLQFRQKLMDAFRKADQNEKMAAIVFLDLDRFKIINDTLGHHVGDELLVLVSNKLKSHIHEQNFVARFGGDEFIILMSNVNHVDEVTKFAESISALLDESFMYENQELFITSSIGISLYPQDGTDVDTLIKNADTAMYRAKEKGGHAYELYHSDMNLRSLERLNMEIQLRRALERNEIIIHYQPLIDLRTGVIFGMESLVRWNHSTMGLISPGEFIPVAEETGLIIPLGNWVLIEACRQNKIWNEMGLGNLRVSVNISVKQFQQPNFYKIVENVLIETDLDPSLLCLEITENIAMMNVSYIVDTLTRLKELGVQISIDDFGTGYSSLSYLKRFRVHTLKIDKSFIKDLTTDEETAAIVKAMITMSRQLNMKCLAEGVENLQQLQFLKEHGCDEIQGYIFSRPLPHHQFETLIREKKGTYQV